MRLKNWSMHCKNLGNDARLLVNISLHSMKNWDELEIDSSPFTINELRAATKQFKTAKAFKPDNIPASISKNELFHKYLRNLYRHTFSLKQPRPYHLPQIIPMLKKDAISLATTRGISPMSIAIKLYNERFRTAKFHMLSCYSETIKTDLDA